MERKNRNWFYLVPVAGAVFCLWYLYTSFYDVVYSDYTVWSTAICRTCGTRRNSGCRIF